MYGNILKIPVDNKCSFLSPSFSLLGPPQIHTQGPAHQEVSIRLAQNSLSKVNTNLKSGLLCLLGVFSFYTALEKVDNSYKNTDDCLERVDYSLVPLKKLLPTTEQNKWILWAISHNMDFQGKAIKIYYLFFFFFLPCHLYFFFFHESFWLHSRFTFFLGFTNLRASLSSFNLLCCSVCSVVTLVTKCPPKLLCGCLPFNMQVVWAWQYQVRE